MPNHIPRSTGLNVLLPLAHKGPDTSPITFPDTIGFGHTKRRPQAQAHPQGSLGTSVTCVKLSLTLLVTSSESLHLYNKYLHDSTPIPLYLPSELWIGLWRHKSHLLALAPVCGTHVVDNTYKVDKWTKEDNSNLSALVRETKKISTPLDFRVGLWLTWL